MLGVVEPILTRRLADEYVLDLYRRGMYDVIPPEAAQALGLRLPPLGAN
jgi:hypothetical protein